MGHYDDCYEADRLASEGKRRRDLVRWIKEGLDDVEYVSQLELIYDVIQNIEDYQGFANTIQRVAKSKRF